MGKAAVGKVVRTCWHAVVMRFAQRSAVIATRRRVRQDIRKTRKFQAVLTLLPVRDGAEPLRLTWPAWRAVLRAPDHATRAGQLCSALISSDDGVPPPGQSNLVVTMVVVGA